MFPKRLAGFDLCKWHNQCQKRRRNNEDCASILRNLAVIAGIMMFALAVKALLP